jgi:septal ring factor EnvC (AmiA/AmiB activator)
VTPTPDYSAEIAQLGARINALGPRPPGDPDELNAFAHLMRREADKVLALAQREARIPAQLIFKSHGATRLYANIAEVASSFIAAYETLEDAAHAIRHRANQIVAAQGQWDAQRTSLDGRRADLQNLSRRAGR